MPKNADKNTETLLTQWVGPVVVSALVFGILMSTSLLGIGFAVTCAVLIAAGGIALLYFS